VRFAHASLDTGVRLHYAEQGDAGGRPIVCLHGFTDSWFSFSRVLPLFPADWHSYAISQRGHGDSERPEAGYTMPELAADVVAFMDVMGLPQATIVGHSMGSLVAIELARALPSRVARLVLVGSATTMRSEDVLALKQEVDALTDPVPEAFARAFQESTIHHPVPLEFLAGVVAESLKVPARVWRAALDGQLAADYTEDVRQIRTPTLVLRGSADTLFPQASRDALVSGLPNRVFKSYSDTGHAPHWERPEAFVRDVQEFFGG
jgi:pimeloyl-ACP methyl ester carboxylesterase